MNTSWPWCLLPGLPSLRTRCICPERGPLLSIHQVYFGTLCRSLCGSHCSTQRPLVVSLSTVALSSLYGWKQPLLHKLCIAWLCANRLVVTILPTKEAEATGPPRLSARLLTSTLTLALATTSTTTTLGETSTKTLGGSLWLASRRSRWKLLPWLTPWSSCHVSLKL